MRRASVTVVLLAATLLGGCVRFGAKPPERLLTIASTATMAPGAQAQSSSGAVTILDPDVPRALTTLRVLVRASDNSVAYVKKAVWVDSPRNLFRSLLAETVAARTGMLVYDPGQYVADPGRRLMGDLIAFNVDARTQVAVVTFDASLVSRDGTIVKRRFSATAPITQIDATHVAPAIQAAANEVAVQVADWLKAG